MSGSSNCVPDLQRYGQVCNSVQGYSVTSLHGASNSSYDVSCISNENKKAVVKYLRRNLSFCSSIIKVSVIKMSIFVTWGGMINDHKLSLVIFSEKFPNVWMLSLSLFNNTKIRETGMIFLITDLSLFSAQARKFLRN